MAKEKENALLGFTANLVKRKNDERYWSVSKFLNNKKYPLVKDIVQYLKGKDIPFNQKEQDGELEGSLLVLPLDCNIEYTGQGKEEVEPLLLEKLNKTEKFCFMVTKKGLSFEGSLKQLKVLMDDGWK